MIRPIQVEKAAFPLAAISTALLAYSSLPLFWKGWIFALGSLLPWVMVLGEAWFGPAPPQEKRNEGERASRWEKVGWVLLAVLGLLPRFWRITEDFLWPTGDEGLHGFLALDLARGWNGQFFYTVGEHPPLLIWSLAALFKLGAGGFVALWSLPAIFSWLAVPFGYGAARPFLGVRAALLFTFLLAVSYWPLSLGRYCHQGLFIPFWELAGLCAVVWISRVTDPAARAWAMAALGLWIGLGTLTFTAWWVVFFGFGFGVLWLTSKGDRRPQAAYFLGALLGAAPFLGAAVREGYGHHLLDSSWMNRDLSPAHSWITRISYLTSLFGGSLQAGTSYGPQWGGVLNPVLGAAFLLGLGCLVRDRAQVWARAILLGLVLGPLPGLLSGDYVELNRIIPVLPFVLITCALGLERTLVLFRDPGKGRAGLLLLLMGSTLLDGLHYWKPIAAPEWARLTGKDWTGSDPDYRAFRILQARAGKEGPGLILTDFMPLQYGHTLFVTTHSFNAAEDPDLDPKSARWAALVTDIHYVPFLKARWPQAQWSRFGDPSPGLEGGMALGIVPVDPSDREDLERCVEVHHLFHRMNLEAERSFNGRPYFEAALKDAWSIYPSVRGDRFLSAVYWEWISQFYFGPDPGLRIRALQRAVQEGYPAAHLLEGLSRSLVLAKRSREAAQAHQAALREWEGAPWP